MSGADAPSDEGELHPGNYRPLMSEQRAQRIRRWHEGAYCRAKDSAGGRQMWPVSNAVNTAGIRSTRVSAKSCSRSAARRVQANAARISSAAYGGDSTNRATSPTPASESHNPPSTMVASNRACSWDNCRARARNTSTASAPVNARISIPASSAPNSGPGTMSTRPSGINCRTITAETLQAGSDSLGRHEHLTSASAASPSSFIGPSPELTATRGFARRGRRAGRRRDSPHRRGRGRARVPPPRH
jgi:hypothetical protein